MAAQLNLQISEMERETFPALPVVRRVVGCVERCGAYSLGGHSDGWWPRCPYGEPGDRIYPWLRGERTPDFPAGDPLPGDFVIGQIFVLAAETNGDFVWLIWVDRVPSSDLADAEST